MKKRISSKSSTKMTALIAALALMGSFAGCSATITAETTEARETTEAKTETTTEASSEETTTAASSADETTAAAQDETSADEHHEGTGSYPERITDIDDNLFGIDIPVYGDEDTGIVDYIVNIREGDTIEEGGGYDTLIPVGEADADVVYIVYNVNLSSQAMSEYCDQFIEEGYDMDVQDYHTFAGNNADGYRVVAQSIEDITTVAVYDYESNPDAGVGGLG